MSSKTASGAGEPVIQLITRFCSSSIFLVGRTPPRSTAVEEVEAVAGVEAEAPKRTPTPLTTPQNHQAPNLMQNDQLCPVGGRLGSFAHLWPLVTSYQFMLKTVTKGYRIEFMGNPPRTTEAWCTPIPRKTGLESMLEKRAIREIPLSTDVPGFYSPIFLVAKAPDPQPESVQQIRKAPTLSDGDITYGDGLLRGSAPAEAKDLRTFEGLLNVRDVGSLYRFKRRLFSGTSARSHAVLGKQTRLPRKRRKVSVNTHTVPSLPGIDPRPHQHAHFSEQEEGRQSVASRVLTPSAEPSGSKDLAEALRTSVQSTRVSPHGGDSQSSYPAYAPQPVDAGLGQPIPPNIPGPRVAQGIGVVGITGQPDGRPPVLFQHRFVDPY